MCVFHLAQNSTRKDFASLLLTFRMPYRSYVGGVISFPPLSYENINGFSNMYFGWGGEDDDLNSRYVVCFPSFLKICSDITIICLCNISQFFTAVKTIIFRRKVDIFLIFAKNIDCAYTLESPQSPH